MGDQKGNKVNLREETGHGNAQLPLDVQRQFEEMQLTIQRLQHRWRVYEGPRTVQDDVETVVKITSG